MKNILIRKAKKQDIPAINFLTKEMHRFLGKLAGKHFSAKQLKDEEVSVSELNGIIVADDVKNNKIVGYLSFSQKPEEDEWYGKHIYLYEFAVTKEYRGKGIGEELMKSFIEMCRKRNLNIKIDTLVKNHKTIVFYKRMGFKPFMLYFIKESKH